MTVRARGHRRPWHPESHRCIMRDALAIESAANRSLNHAVRGTRGAVRKAPRRPGWPSRNLRITPPRRVPQRRGSPNRACSDSPGSGDALRFALPGRDPEATLKQRARTMRTRDRRQQFASLLVGQRQARPRYPSDVRRGSGGFWRLLQQEGSDLLDRLGEGESFAGSVVEFGTTQSRSIALLTVRSVPGRKIRLGLG
jgi:hypothetical protein